MPDKSSEIEMQTRGIAGVLMLVVPIVSIVLVGVLYAVINVLGHSGRQAEGSEVTIAFEACPQAREVVSGRLAFMGLDAQWLDEADPSSFRVRTRLPNTPEAPQRVPQVLLAPGVFEIRTEQGERVVEAQDVVGASVTLPFLAVPHTVVTLSPEAGRRLESAMKADPEGKLVYWLDGERVDTVHNLPVIEHGEVVIERAELTERERITFAAEAAAMLSSGPMPCEAHLRGVQ